MILFIYMYIIYIQNTIPIILSTLIKSQILINQYNETLDINNGKDINLLNSLEYGIIIIFRY